MPFKIRRGALADMEALLDLLNMLFAIETDFSCDSDRQRRGLELILNDDLRSCLMVAAFDQEIVGMCSAQLLFSTAAGGAKAIVEDLVVAEKFRGQGIGTQLLKSVSQWAIEHGAKRLDLLADQRNHPALQFYNSLDWTPTHMICIQKKVTSG